MNIRLIAVPYDSGIRGWRMGAGPERLLSAGAADRLRAAGHAVAVEQVDLPDAATPEVHAAFAIARQLSGRVADARTAGELPIVLAGNCVSSIGILSGLADAHPAIIWLDAHADLNTPETTRSGMLDGMSLAIATGRCWRDMASTIPGFRPIPDAQICLIGTRDVDEGEAELLRAARIPAIRPSELATGLSAALDDLRTRTETAYLHIDLDVLDPGEGIVNPFSAAGGLRLAQLLDVIATVRQRFALGAVALTAYDPSYDADARITAAALAILDALATGE
jgi:arginase